MLVAPFALRAGAAVALLLSACVYASASASAHTREHVSTPAHAIRSATAPSVIFTVIVDDLGWNNVGWHQPSPPPTPENGTPRLTALAREGVVLDRHTVHFTCTPSRSAYLTGRLPVHVQQTLANPDKPTAGIPRNMTALPWKLKEGGYATHIAGKWDMGMATPDHTPEGRGFDSSLIYFEHMNFYYDQLICPTGTSCDMGTYSYLRDFWDSGAPAAPNPNLTYIEYLFRDRIMDVIEKHDMSQGPLYLQYTSHVAHWPLQVPQDWYERFDFVQDDEPACGDKIPRVWPGANSSVLSCRRQYAAMVAMVDEIVGNATDLLRAKGWWNDTLMIFTADNGGSIAPSENAASNYPLRGGKYAPMEGGTRAASFVSGGYLPPAVRGSTLEGYVHMADWYGTLCGLVGVDPTDAKANNSIPRLPPVDSLDVWPMLSGANLTSPRTEVPVSPNALLQVDAAGGHVWKLYNGSISVAGWQGPTYPNATSPANDPSIQMLHCPEGCLFDVLADPSEHVDVATSQPGIVTSMLARLAVLQAGFYSNSDVGVPICPANVTGDCACWVAANVYGGNLGPWEK